MRILTRALMCAVVLMMVSRASFAQLQISVSFGPPALPVYDQPPCPGDDYIWTPGFWGWDADDEDYYWVPGTWVEAPEPGLFWTPPYWAWADGHYVFYDGYWGPHVGFYGGIDYGFGYFGDGFEGGRWDRGHFYYNRSVTNVNVTVVHNVYNTTVVHNTTVVNRVSYNGGNGGVNARPTARDEEAARDHHVERVAAQTRNRDAARSNREFRASANQGKPPVAATAKPAEFNGRDVVHAKEAGAPYHPPANRGNANNNRPAENNRPNENNRSNENGRPGTPAANDHNNNQRPTFTHPNDIPKAERSAPPNTGNARTDQKYQQQQQKLAAKQDQERAKLQQRQDQEHQRMTQQKADQARQQQVEQKHQQQTQKLQQRQEQQQQHLQQRQAPRPSNQPKEKH